MDGLKNIILIGYRATGKSSVGRQLAQELGLVFVDLDDAIVAKAAMTIDEMVSRYGWPHFRALEKRELLARSGQQGRVIATGGGAVLHQDIWPTVRQGNLVVWLQAGVETIIARLRGDGKSDEQRPSLTGREIGVEVAEVLGQRLPLYRKSCDVEINAEQSVQQICAAIVALRDNYGRK